jgi:hypothetical protein
MATQGESDAERLLPTSAAQNKMEDGLAGIEESGIYEMDNTENTEEANNTPPQEDPRPTQITGASEDSQSVVEDVHHNEARKITRPSSSINPKENQWHGHLTVPGGTILGRVHGHEEQEPKVDSLSATDTYDSGFQDRDGGEDTKQESLTSSLTSDNTSSTSPDATSPTLPIFDPYQPKSPQSNPFPLGPLPPEPCSPTPVPTDSSSVPQSPPDPVTPPAPPPPSPPVDSYMQPSPLEEKCLFEKEITPTDHEGLVIANPVAQAMEEDVVDQEEKCEKEDTSSPPSYSATAEPPSPEEVEATINDVGSHEVHLFWQIIGKDEEIPKGEYGYDCSCSCSCIKCCGTCVMGYKVNKIKGESVRRGPTMAATQWEERKHPKLGLLIKCFVLLIKVALFILSICKFGSRIYQTAQRGQILFDVVSAFVLLIGSGLSTLFLIVFIGRRYDDLTTGWKCCCLCMKDVCTAEHIKLTCFKCCECTCCGRCNRREIADTVEDRMKGSRCCGLCSTTLQRLSGLQTKRGRTCTIIGNFSEMILTVVNQIIATMILILKLYAFFGEEKYRTFYGVTEYSEVTDLIIVFLALILFLESHIERVVTIALNIHKFDKDISNVPEEKFKKNCCVRAFSFQWRLVIHSIFLSLLQILCLFALAWKIIRDHCYSPQEFLSASSSMSSTNQIVPGTGNVGPGVISPTSSYVPTQSPTGIYGQLTNCSLPSLEPHTVNGYTVYNIIYISIILPLMSYLVLFVSNAAFFVEYSQLLHVSGLHKFEKAVEESKEKEIEEGVPSHHLWEVLLLFFNVLRPNDKISKEELDRKKDQITAIRAKIQDDIINGDYANFGKKFEATLTFIPAIIVGFFHVALFFVHIGFLTCRYSAESGVTCASSLDMFSVFSPSNVAVEEIALIVVLIALFFLTGFPGPVLTVLWIGVFLAVVAIVSMLVASVVFVIALICLFAMFGNSSNTVQTP